MTKEEMNKFVRLDASKQSKDDNNEQIDSEGVLRKLVRDVLDEESKLD